MKPKHPLSYTILSEIIKKINDKTLELASLPDIIVKVNDVVNDENSSLLDVARVVHHDVALTARIMQIANSPAIRGSNQISSILEAINRLGITLVKNLAICVSLKDRLKLANNRHRELIIEELELSYKHGIYLHTSATLVEKKLANSLMIAGLLGNIGRIVVLKYISEHTDMPNADTLSILDDIGLVVSEKILNNWGFSPEILAAVFASAEVNLADPKNSHDLYQLTYLFLTNKLPEELQTKTQEFFNSKREELTALESLFT